MALPNRRMKHAFIIWFVAIVCAHTNEFRAEAQWQGLGPSWPVPPISSEIIRESNTVPLTSGMLGNFMPSIPNLQFGFQYFAGEKFRGGQFNADYLFPFNIDQDAVVFGEAHGNYWNYGEKPAGAATHSVDFSFGGGYRRMISQNFLAGLNAFYDMSQPYYQWYASGSIGLEVAANVGATEAADFHVNWYYGNLYSSTGIDNGCRNQGSNYDFGGGYSLALVNAGLDLHLRMAGYKFDVGNSSYGYKAGADLTTRNGLFTISFDHGNDKINGPWNNFGAFLNVGFLISRYIIGEIPFTMPEPVFNGQRNLSRMLSSPVARAAAPTPPTPPAPPSPQPVPTNLTAFALANAVVPPPGAAQPFGFPFDTPLSFPPGSTATTATIAVANPPEIPVLISLYDGQGNKTRNLWIVLASQTISQTDFPDWFTGGPWKGIQVINNMNEGVSNWIPVSFTLTYQ